MLAFYLLAFAGIKDEDGDIDDLHESTRRVDGNDEKAMRVDDWEAIEYPQAAVEQGRHVRHPRVALGRSPFQHFDECWATPNTQVFINYFKI